MVTTKYRRKGELIEDVVYKIMDLESLTYDRGFKGYQIEVPRDSHIDLTPVPVISIYTKKRDNLARNVFEFRNENPGFKGAIYGSFNEATGFGNNIFMQYEALSKIMNLGKPPKELLDIRRAYKEAIQETELAEQRKDAERQTQKERIELSEKRTSPARDVFVNAGLVDERDARNRVKIVNLKDDGSCALTYKHCLDEDCDRKTRFHQVTDLENIASAAENIAHLIEDGLPDGYNIVHLNGDGSLNEIFSHVRDDDEE